MRRVGCPGAFKGSNEITVLTDPTLKAIAEKHGKSTAQVHPFAKARRK
jgi:hypothetical protein